ncbi:uncharacterized protein BKCO1_21000126 [Diplodia corticola]|uniref:Uncharacterized protein n=1 Tax=Diplodia corticola TaxID=236234 RepID=A0A1J9R2A7_9PEZI|nr:uncharacterized protein BKCO1_21000126 [Diplodia corticola]OJD34768.1 hypothetical protein BKCO1_21000126 [Diplodia corticola]
MFHRKGGWDRDGKEKYKYRPTSRSETIHPSTDTGSLLPHLPPAWFAVQNTPSMPPKRQSDGTYHSPRGKTGTGREENRSFEQILLDEAWIGYWDDQWSIAADSQFARRFDRDTLSYLELTDTRPGQVKTFVVEGREPDDKTGFAKELNKKSAFASLGEVTLVPVPFKGDLWVSASSIQWVRVIPGAGEPEELFALFGYEMNKWPLGGFYHEKYSYLLNEEVPGQRGYSTKYFAFVPTGLPVPSSRTSGVHGQASNLVETSYDSSFGQMDEAPPTQEPDHTPSSYACSMSRATDVSQKRSETLGPGSTLRNGSSPTDPPVASIEASSSQEEENPAAARGLLEQFHPRACSMRPPNANSEYAEGSTQNQKRRRDYEDDGTGDAGKMPPPPPPKHPRMTGLRGCGPNASPTEDVQPCSSSDARQRRAASESSGRKGPSPAAQTPPYKPKHLARFSIQGSALRDKTATAQLDQPPPLLPPLPPLPPSGHTREEASPHEPSPPPDQRRDSPMQQQRSPSDTTTSHHHHHQSEEQQQQQQQRPRGGSAASSSSASSPCTRAAQPALAKSTPPPLAIRTSPAPGSAAAAAAPAGPPVLQSGSSSSSGSGGGGGGGSGFDFDVNRALFKLVVVGGYDREYGLRFHGCHTVQALFRRVADRLDDELRAGDALKRLIFHVDHIDAGSAPAPVSRLSRKGVVVAGDDDEPGFSILLSRLADALGASGRSHARQHVIAVEVEVARRR